MVNMKMRYFFTVPSKEFAKSFMMRAEAINGATMDIVTVGWVVLLAFFASSLALTVWGRGGF